MKSQSTIMSNQHNDFLELQLYYENIGKQNVTKIYDNFDKKVSVSVMRIGELDSHKETIALLDFCEDAENNNKRRAENVNLSEPKKQCQQTASMVYGNEIYDLSGINLQSDIYVNPKFIGQKSYLKHQVYLFIRFDNQRSFLLEKGGETSYREAFLSKIKVLVWLLRYSTLLNDDVKLDVFVKGYDKAKKKNNIVGSGAILLTLVLKFGSFFAHGYAPVTDVTNLMSYVSRVTTKCESKREIETLRYNDRGFNRYRGRRNNDSPRITHGGGYDERERYKRGPIVPPPSDIGRYYDEPRNSRHGFRVGGYDNHRSNMQRSSSHKPRSSRRRSRANSRSWSDSEHEKGRPRSRSRSVDSFEHTHAARDEKKSSRRDRGRSDDSLSPHKPRSSRRRSRTRSRSWSDSEKGHPCGYDNHRSNRQRSSSHKPRSSRRRSHTNSRSWSDSEHEKDRPRSRSRSVDSFEHTHAAEKYGTIRDPRTS